MWISVYIWRYFCRVIEHLVAFDDGNLTTIECYRDASFRIAKLRDAPGRSPPDEVDSRVGQEGDEDNELLDDDDSAAAARKNTTTKGGWPRLLKKIVANVVQYTKRWPHFKQTVAIETDLMKASGISGKQ